MNEKNTLTPSSLHIPDYHNIFPKGGNATVKVHFGPKSKCDKDWLPHYKFSWRDLNRLFNPDTGMPYEIMLFDDGFWRVDEYRISVAKKLVTIVVGEPAQG